MKRSKEVYVNLLKRLAWGLAFLSITRLILVFLLDMELTVILSIWAIAIVLIWVSVIIFSGKTENYQETIIGAVSNCFIETIFIVVSIVYFNDHVLLDFQFITLITISGISIISATIGLFLITLIRKKV